MSLVQDTAGPGQTLARTAEVAGAIRSLMVHVETAPETLPRLHAAVDLARRLDAVLIGVGVEAFLRGFWRERVAKDKKIPPLESWIPIYDWTDRIAKKRKEPRQSIAPDWHATIIN